MIIKITLIHNISSYNVVYLLIRIKSTHHYFEFGDVMINKFNQLVDCSDLGKLILRVSLGVLMLLHGLHKMEPGGLAGIQGMLANFNLPAFIAYGIVIGEVVAPILLIIGLFTRASALVLAGTMFVAVLMVHSGDLFALNPKTGGWAPESAGFYLFAAIAVMFLGSGRFAIKKD